MINFSLKLIVCGAHNVRRNVHFLKFNCNVHLEKKSYVYICVHSIRANDLFFPHTDVRPCLTCRYIRREEYKEFEIELKFRILLKAKIHTSSQCFCSDFRRFCTFLYFVKYDTLNGWSCLRWRRQWPSTSPLRGDLRYLWGPGGRERLYWFPLFAHGQLITTSVTSHSNRSKLSLAWRSHWCRTKKGQILAFIDWLFSNL